MHFEKWTSRSAAWLDKHETHLRVFVIERALKVIRQRAWYYISRHISTVSRYKISRDDAIERTGRLRIIIRWWKYKRRDRDVQCKSICPEKSDRIRSQARLKSSRLISMHYIRLARTRDDSQVYSGNGVLVRDQSEDLLAIGSPSRETIRMKRRVRHGERRNIARNGDQSDQRVINWKIESCRGRENWWLEAGRLEAAFARAANCANRLDWQAVCVKRKSAIAR